MQDIRVRFPPGHFYSPVVSPTKIRDYVLRERNETASNLLGLKLPTAQMAAFWIDNLEFIKSTPFAPEPGEQDRYYYRNSSFGRGDAIVLRAMINANRPRRIIEIGSGFSTACILDSASHAGIRDLQLTCVEPYPNRLNEILRCEDRSRLELIEKVVQELPVDRVRELQKGDILFIDSTHVLKTGSDVHYELFHLLPNLSSGVIIHFHDIQFPFEYPDAWIFEENYSWNETYAVRAFLMYNEAFQITFFNNLFGRIYSHLVAEVFPDLAAFPESFGGSLWLTKVA
jgi:predicted O-methyltransferase YrrM